MKGKNKITGLLVFFLVPLIACEEVLEPSLENMKVIQLAPVDDLVSTSMLQTFYWDPMNGASKYQLQIVSPKFDSIVQLISDTTITTNQFSYSLTKGKYQWRVRAINFSTRSDYSEIRKMTIQ